MGNNIQISKETILTFTDSPCNDSVDSGRIWGYGTFRKAGAVDYGSHLPKHIHIDSHDIPKQEW